MIGEAAASASDVDTAVPTSDADALRHEARQLFAQSSTDGRPENVLANVKSCATATRTSDVEALRNEAWQLLAPSSTDGRRESPASAMDFSRYEAQ